MKALVYEKAHALDRFAIELREVAEPTLREHDVLVEVHAIGVNPGEAFIRSVRSAEPGGRVLLGWEFGGVVIATGSSVRGFSIGDRVFGTGDMTRDGCWAERVAVPWSSMSAENPASPALPGGSAAEPDREFNAATASGSTWDSIR